MRYLLIIIKMLSQSSERPFGQVGIYTVLLLELLCIWVTIQVHCARCYYESLHDNSTVYVSYQQHSHPRGHVLGVRSSVCVVFPRMRICVCVCTILFLNTLQLPTATYWIYPAHTHGQRVTTTIQRTRTHSHVRIH